MKIITMFTPGNDEDFTKHTDILFSTLRAVVVDYCVWAKDTSQADALEDWAREVCAEAYKEVNDDSDS